MRCLYVRYPEARSIAKVAQRRTLKTARKERLLSRMPDHPTSDVRMPMEAARVGDDEFPAVTDADDVGVLPDVEPRKDAEDKRY